MWPCFRELWLHSGLGILGFREPLGHHLVWSLSFSLLWESWPQCFRQHGGQVAQLLDSVTKPSLPLWKRHSGLGSSPSCYAISEGRTQIWGLQLYSPCESNGVLDSINQSVSELLHCKSSCDVQKIDFKYLLSRPSMGLAQGLRISIVLKLLYAAADIPHWSLRCRSLHTGPIAGAEEFFSLSTTISAIFSKSKPELSPSTGNVNQAMPLLRALPPQLFCSLSNIGQECIIAYNSLWELGVKFPGILPACQNIAII